MIFNARPRRDKYKSYFIEIFIENCYLLCYNEINNIGGTDEKAIGYGKGRR
jgi:hypothetical protein